MTCISNIPPELLLHVFSFLSFGELFPRCAVVSKSWARALRASKRITIVATPKVKSTGIMAIVARFPLLEHLELAPAERRHWLDNRTALLHAVARQFEGHANLRSIVCTSDFIVCGALKGCPRLRRLVLGSTAAHDDQQIVESAVPADNDDDDAEDSYDDVDSEAETIFRRNLGYFLHKNTSVEHLEIDMPLFPRTDHPFFCKLMARSSPSTLRSLKISSISTWSLLNLFDWCSQNERALLNLTELELELDYLHLPSNTMRALSRCSPDLERLKLRFAILAPMQIYEMAEHLPRLRSLSLSKCDVWFESGNTSSEVEPVSRVNYASIVAFLSAALPWLSSLHFNQCSLHELPDAIKLSEQFLARIKREKQCMHKRTALTDVKVFDSGEHRLSEAELARLLRDDHALTSLRADIPLTSLMGGPHEQQNARVWEDAARASPDLKELELRCSRYRTIPAVKIADQFAFAKLESISLWSFPFFPEWSLRLNALTLRKVCFIFVATPVTNAESIGAIPLPNLAELEIRSVGASAHQVCESYARLLVPRSPNVRRVSLEALQRDSAPISDTLLETLGAACTKLTHLRLASFRVSRALFRKMARFWPVLCSIELIGPKAVDEIDTDIDQAVFHRFFIAHRSLREFRITVQKITLPHFKLIDAEEARKRMDARKTADTAVTPSAGKATDDERTESWNYDFLRLCQNLNVSTYRQYAEDLARRYWWVKTISIRGPYNPANYDVCLE